MKKISLALLVLLLASLACGVFPFNTVQGSGNVIRQSFEVDGADRVELKTAGRVELVQGEADSLTIETDDNILPRLIVKVEDGKLILDEEPGLNLRPGVDIIYHLTLKSMTSLAVSSSGAISTGPVKAGSLELAINGSGMISMESLEAQDLLVSSSGSGEVSVSELEAENVNTRGTASGSIRLSGECRSLSVLSNGSGDALLGDLQTTTADVTAQASGDVTVWALDELDASVSGSGDVFYYGSPAVTERVSGSGRLRELGGK